MDIEFSGDLRQRKSSISYSADRISFELLTEGAALLSHYTSLSVLRRRYRCVRETGSSSERIIASNTITPSFLGDLASRKPRNALSWTLRPCPTTATQCY